jgi:hypothetical protein
VHTVTKQPITKAPTVIEDTPRRGSASPTVSGGMGLAYERFLELPVRVVVLVLWVGGVALLGALTLVVYALISALVGILAGAF